MGMRVGLSRVVAFLRTGYPAGVPARGYVPLVALLPRRLTDDEVMSTMRKLAARFGWPIGRVDIGVEITHVTDEMPSNDDIVRVQERLNAGRPPTES
jgi:hypothetical protein